MKIIILIGLIAVIYIVLRTVSMLNGMKMLKDVGLNSVQQDAYLRIADVVGKNKGRKLTMDEHRELAVVVRAMSRPEIEGIACGLINDPETILAFIEQARESVKIGMPLDGWWD